MARREDGEPSEPEGEAGRRPEGQALPEEHAVHEGHPERHGGHDQRRDPGVDVLLGPHDPAVAAEEQCPPDDGRGPPLPPGRPFVHGVASPQRPAIEDGAREDEPDAGHEERRHGPDRDSDGQVGRAPDDVQGEQREPDGEGRNRPGLLRCRGAFERASRGVTARPDHRSILTRPS